MSAGFEQWGADHGIPEGRVAVASYEAYQEAEEAVDYLADNEAAARGSSNAHPPRAAGARPNGSSRTPEPRALRKEKE